VRCCLGASPWRIARQLLVESLLLACGGAVLGLGLAFAGVRALEHFLTERVTHVHEVGIEPRVLLFTLGVTLVTAMLFGLAPAVRGASVDLNLALKEAARGSRGARTQWLNQAFVVSQLALSLMLLVGAGLLFAQLSELLDVDLGFRPENVLVGRVSLPQTAYPDAPRIRAFYAQLAERSARVAGVRSAGLSSSAPFSSAATDTSSPSRARAGSRCAQPRRGDPERDSGYFEAVATGLQRGRVIEESDTEAAPRVAVVDETFARHFWPDGNAIGQQYAPRQRYQPRALAHDRGRRRERQAHRRDGRAAALHLHAAGPGRHPIDGRRRSDGWRPATATAAIRREVQDLDPTLPFYEVHALAGAVSRSLGTRRLTNLLLQASPSQRCCWRRSASTA
jgi:hypothetical protein